MIKRALLLPFLAVALTGATPAPGTYVAFIACPLMRDTPEKYCWLAQYGRNLYYLGTSEGRQHHTRYVAPQMGYRILVEGKVAAGESICGGIPLDPVETSDIERREDCDKILPTDGYVSPKGRPHGPDEAFTPGNVPEKLYDQNDVTARRPLSFDISYDFNSERLIYPKQASRVEQAQAYAKAIGAREIRVTAHRGSNLLSNGRVITENDYIGAKRLKNILQILDAFGLPSSQITSEARKEADRPKGAGDGRSRRVQIDILP